MTIADPDPKKLVHESYRIEGITLEECRSIFLDWALSVPMDADHIALIKQLMLRHDVPDHPMTEVLKAGLDTYESKPKRRGGFRSRPRP